MNVNTIIISLTLSFGGLVIAWLSYNLGKKNENKQEVKEAKQDVKEDATTQTSLKMQLEYISRGIDDIKLEMRDIKQDAKAQDEKINILTVKIATLEASLKSFHKRVDELEQRINENERK